MATQDPTPERWLPVVGFEGYYEVSDLGRVRSLSRRVITTRNNQGWYPMKGRILSPFKHAKGGHLMVPMGVNGKITRRMVHHLVLEAFVGLAPVGHECDHINFDPEDNRVENLRWVTHTENIRHTAQAGRGYRGELNGRNKLTDAMVRQIRHQRASGMKLEEIAKAFPVSITVISKICLRKAWKHVE